MKNKPDYDGFQEFVVKSVFLISSNSAQDLSSV
jgi:hypothetical protein